MPQIKKIFWDVFKIFLVLLKLFIAAAIASFFSSFILFFFFRGIDGEKFNLITSLYGAVLGMLAGPFIVGRYLIGIIYPIILILKWRRISHVFLWVIFPTLIASIAGKLESSDIPYPMLFFGFTGFLMGVFNWFFEVKLPQKRKQKMAEV